MSIIAEILEAARRGVSRNQIRRKVSLSSRQMSQCLWFACQNDLLNPKKDNAEYETTDKGFRFLENYYKVMELLRVENNKESRRRPALNVARALPLPKKVRESAR